MTEGDNDPVGILLVTEKSNALTPAGNDNLFVSKYQLHITHKRTIRGVYAEGNGEVELKLIPN